MAFDYSSLKAVFFDMDGVLYDSMPNHESTWVASFKKFGVDFPSKEAYLNEGATSNYTIDYAFKKFKKRLPTEKELAGIYEEKTRLMPLCPEAPLFEDMAELIKSLKQNSVQVFVVTGSKQPTLVDRLSNDFNIPATNIVCGRDVINGKPHPEPYLMAWGRTKLDKSQCCVVENAPLGIQSARAAGIYTIGINTGLLDTEILKKAGANEVYESSADFVKGFMKKICLTAV